MQEIVIKIDENVYTRLFDNGIQDNEIATDDILAMAKAIRKGTPLPKGHGRIGDLDALNNDLREQQRSYEHTFGIRNGIIIARCHIDHAPTIIEADRSEE